MLKLNKYFIVALAGMVLGMSGCARMQKVENNVNSTHKRVKTLEIQINTLTKAIDDLNINQGGATSKMKADLTMLLKQLETQLDRLHAEMDESQFRMKQLEKKVDILSSQRLLYAADTVSTSDSTASGSGITPGQVKVVPGLDVEKLYHQAREDYIVGKYDLAFKGFQTVFEKDKAGTFKDNALYWMGECYYKQEKFDKARKFYSRCIKEYPHGNKLCSALFKLGMVNQKKGDTDGRNKVWKTLIDKCSGSNEAHRAKEMMK